MLLALLPGEWFAAPNIWKFLISVWWCEYQFAASLGWWCSLSCRNANYNWNLSCLSQLIFEMSIFSITKGKEPIICTLAKLKFLPFSVEKRRSSHKQCILKNIKSVLFTSLFFVSKVLRLLLRILPKLYIYIYLFIVHIIHSICRLLLPFVKHNSLELPFNVEYAHILT